MHNLNYNENAGRYSFVSAKEPCWHKCGTVLDHVFTASEAIEHACLDFTVEKQNLLTNRGLDVTNFCSTVREDTRDVFGVVGKGYEIIQNRDCFTFFDNIVGRGQAIFETAGALQKGQIVFITAKLPGDVVIGPVDLVKNYIALITSHDGSLALSSFFTPVRIVCNNTLDMALRDCVNRVYMKHTTNIQENMFNAARMMNLHSKYMDIFGQAMNLLYDTKITDADLKMVIERTFLTEKQLHTLAKDGDVEISTRKTNTIKSVMEYYEANPTLDGIRGTAYGIFNAITGYYQNVYEYSSDDQKFKSLIMHGTAHNYAQKAFNSLLKV